jgi:hypothetical protein
VPSQPPIQWVLGDSFSRGYTGHVQLTTHLHVLPWLRISRPTPLLLLHAFMTWTGTTSLLWVSKCRQIMNMHICTCVWIYMSRHAEVSPTAMLHKVLKKWTQSSYILIKPHSTYKFVGVHKKWLKIGYFHKPYSNMSTKTSGSWLKGHKYLFLTAVTNCQVEVAPCAPVCRRRGHRNTITDFFHSSCANINTDVVNHIMWNSGTEFSMMPPEVGKIKASNFLKMRNHSWRFCTAVSLRWYLTTFQINSILQKQMDWKQNLFEFIISQFSPTYIIKASGLPRAGLGTGEKICLGHPSKGGPAKKNLYTKLGNVTVSCRVTLPWCERVNL